jgi:ABC-2 type transport system ATP-binding protein
MTSVLEFHNLVRSYKKNLPVLDEVSFSIEEGEVVGLLGRNGAGKTTLIRIAMGLLYPHSGYVRAFGVSPMADPVGVKKRIGYVAEDQVFPPLSSVSELLSFHRHLFPDWDKSLERQVLRRFDLPIDSNIKNLSKGQARQFALLCAICHRPELLILDEPAGGLDAVVRREFLELSIQLLNQAGTTILFSTHHMNDVERIGARIVLLDRGKVRLDRDLDLLRENTSIALIPKTSAPDGLRVEQTPGRLHVRLVSDEWHVLIEGSPEEVQQRIGDHFGIEGIRCARIPLEELFIEMVSVDS